MCHFSRPRHPLIFRNLNRRVIPTPSLYSDLKNTNAHQSESSSPCKPAHADPCDQSGGVPRSFPNHASHPPSAPLHDYHGSSASMIRPSIPPPGLGRIRLNPIPNFPILPMIFAEHDRRVWRPSRAGLKLGCKHESPILHRDPRTWPLQRKCHSGFFNCLVTLSGLDQLTPSSSL